MLNLKKWMTKVSEALVVPIVAKTWSGIATPEAKYYTTTTFNIPARRKGLIITMGGNSIGTSSLNRISFVQSGMSYYLTGGIPISTGNGNQSFGLMYFECGNSGGTISIQQYGYNTSVVNLNGFALMITIPYIARSNT